MFISKSPFCLELLCGHVLLSCGFMSRELLRLSVLERRGSEGFFFLHVMPLSEWGGGGGGAAYVVQRC